MQRGTQLGDRRRDLLGRHDARAQCAMQAERMRVALPGQHAGAARALACPQHVALRPVFVDHDHRLLAQLRLLPPHELQRQRREIEASNLHWSSVQISVYVVNTTCSINKIDFDAIIDIIDYMAAITIRDLEPEVKERLRVRAAQHGRSMEDEARAILRAAVSRTERAQTNLADAIRKRFASIGGVELALPPREAGREPPKFR